MALALKRIPVSLLFTVAATAASYYPPPGKWESRLPPALGLNAAKLREAVDFAKANDGGWDFQKDQVRTFGTPLGPLPARRALTNGLIIRHGYIAAEFGDTAAADPVYSAAKSFLSAVTGLAVARGLIRDVDDPVALSIHDGGYDSAHNRKITWKNHLRQESEWEGEMWGKNANFIGHESFGAGERRPRAIQDPGSFYEYNDVRINRFALSLLRLFGRALPDILKQGVMDPVGASGTWRWVPYDTAFVEIGGVPLPSVSGGTRWGGGLWMNSQDMARFGLLYLNRGNWAGRQLIPASWVRDSLVPGEHGPDYGYLWWLNTQQRQWPGAPAASFAAIGNGSNTIWVDPEHDIVIVWRWHSGGPAMDGLIRRVLAAVTSD